jgi:tRNA wybutosine-synthesizing protein 2
VLADFDDVSADDMLPEERREALLELHGEIEPVHVEHGTRYALDLSTVMFSPGNEAERARMGEIVESGERVFDAFAGVGYFALPMARAGAEVTAAELDPEAYRLLLLTSELSGIKFSCSSHIEV